MLIGSFMCFNSFKGIYNPSEINTPKSDTIDLKEYAGIYKYFNSPVPSVQIIYRANKLFAFAEGFTESQLHHQSKDVFVDSVYNAVFSFKRKDNKVDTLLMNANGAELVAVKEKP